MRITRRTSTPVLGLRRNFRRQPSGLASATGQVGDWVCGSDILKVLHGLSQRGWRIYGVWVEGFMLKVPRHLHCAVTLIRDTQGRAQSFHHIESTKSRPTAVPGDGLVSPKWNRKIPTVPRAFLDSETVGTNQPHGGGDLVHQRN